MTNKELILANLMRAMIKYDGGDAPRIQHFVKVHDFARMIAIAEGMNEEDLFVLEAAAILHDVGIHVSQARMKYSWRTLSAASSPRRWIISICLWTNSSLT